jgi:hypothetical protein
MEIIERKNIWDLINLLALVKLDIHGSSVYSRHNHFQWKFERNECGVPMQFRKEKGIHSVLGVI